MTERRKGFVNNTGMIAALKRDEDDTVSAEFLDTFASVAGAPAVAVTVPAGSYLPGVPRSSLYAELRWRHVPSGASPPRWSSSTSRASGWTTATSRLRMRPT